MRGPAATQANVYTTGRMENNTIFVKSALSWQAPVLNFFTVRARAARR